MSTQTFVRVICDTCWDTGPTRANRQVARGAVSQLGWTFAPGTLPGEEDPKLIDRCPTCIAEGRGN